MGHCQTGSEKNLRVFSGLPTRRGNPYQENGGEYCQQVQDLGAPATRPSTLIEKALRATCEAKLWPSLNELNYSGT
jgi:hypothetical protein